MKVTIKQIAEKAGVSMTTVSNVINKKAHRVSADKIALIEQIIEEYNYTPNMNARSLVQSSSKLIGLLYFSESSKFVFTDPFVSEVLSGIEEKAKESGYFVLVHNVTSPGDVQTIQKNWSFEGFIVVGVPENNFDEINQVISGPVVYIDTHISQTTKKTVCQQTERVFINTDDYQAGKVATNFLITNHHEKIAFLSYSFDKAQSSVIQQRFLGFESAIEAADLTFNQVDMYNEDEFDRFLANIGNYSAVIVSADYLAAQLLKYLKNREQYDLNKLSIVGFDDISFAELMDPPLTTIRLDAIKKGILAFEMLNKIANQPELEIAQHITLPGELIIRQSVRPYQQR